MPSEKYSWSPSGDKSTNGNTAIDAAEIPVRLESSVSAELLPPAIPDAAVASVTAADSAGGLVCCHTNIAATITAAKIVNRFSR